ncbi:hypothetical protein [Xenorhabdus littoralis]|uniref:hypothetical protein n=1 Tax=Xenorhabdus littoralis TaxID=2582835 RepID=UPI0029E7EE77|nr:hypothetical protein [Xenorhabdus sp. psl]MDX7991829.1 hypothetical protein [Xenorhabdus sp. psl]
MIELTQPLLQRLQAQSVKGISATGIMQIEGGKDADFAFSLPFGTKVQTPVDQTFITFRPCDVQPFMLVGREIAHQDPNEIGGNSTSTPIPDARENAPTILGTPIPEKKIFAIIF